MSLIANYDATIASGDIQDNPLQRQVLFHLDRLINDFALQKKSWFNWLKRDSFLGVYIYGPVGVGKTFLMDLFFESIPVEKKLRFHFHHFMQQIDTQLRQLQGIPNPLQRIANDIAKKAQLLCFDEFMVDDVAYAMILAELMQALFARKVILVATSNVAPDGLYRNGVQRARFLPAIAAIKKHCEVVHLGDNRDYRLGRELNLETYISPLGEAANNLLSKQFDFLAPNAQTYGIVTIQKREIPYIKLGNRTIWFDFKVICNLPRSQLDYLEIAERFDTVFVSDIPKLGEQDTVFAILLIHFIDVMYDQGIRLIASAAVPIDELYTQGEMSQAFKRTQSRLHEMQSIDYIKRHPRRAMSYLSSI
ncbi:ATPase N2B (nucleotide (GTP) binding protein) [Legionella beliardensis]|uniref:ATPase N2B (Nucleotide (GTP) binding protein) n=1 Tax=Legionella beliardensis TaxID=91822 RepID=A0A378I5M0_9GAMM|nr:cell division protein ZapE [Legionella beliardensis]STX30050.1 ATPase N2B (nucleotide (GTP) binding protein) [Legionella beliardensis]